MSWERATEGAASIEMPSPLRRQEQTVLSKRGPLTVVAVESSSRDIQYNLMTFHYPEGAAFLVQNPTQFLEGTAKGMELQKQGAVRVRFHPAEGGAYPSATHEFSYPAGVNGEGQQYEASFSRYRYCLVGMTLYAASADVGSRSYNERAAAIEKVLSRFFDSMVLTPPPAQ